MPTTRSFDNPYGVVEWTDEINEVDNQAGYLNARGIFNVKSTGQTSITFDRTENEIVLLPDANRQGREPSFGKDRTVETFALPLGFFNHADNITPEDIQSQRKPGDANGEETLDRVRAVKLEDLRFAVDQTHEYMKIQAIKGICKTPQGKVLADMPTLFGLPGNDVKEIDFLLGTASTNVDAKIAELKRHIGANLKGAAFSGPIEVLCDESFFDKLINHAKLKEVYLNSTSNVEYQRSLSDFMQWGVMDSFTVRGVTFRSYGHEFTLPSGSTEKAFNADEGYTVLNGRDLYRGYTGPSNKLTGANQPGQPMFAYEYRDPRDEYHEMQVQSAPLMISTKPGTIVRVISSN